MPLRASGAGVVLGFAFPGMKTHQVYLVAHGQTRPNEPLRVTLNLAIDLPKIRWGGLGAVSMSYLSLYK